MTEDNLQPVFKIDTNVLIKLANDISVNMMPKLIDAFLLEVDTRITTIETTPISGNERHLQIQAHSIKSCSRTFGATALAEKAAHIEAMLQNKAAYCDIEYELPQLLAFLPEVKQAYLAYRANLKL